MSNLSDWSERTLIHAWCPLFGELPEVGAPPNSQPFRCVDIIQRARVLWDVDPNDSIYKRVFLSWPRLEDTHKYPEHLLEAARSIYRTWLWPEHEEVPFYGESLLESARSIFRARYSIFQHTMVRDPEKDYYETISGRLKKFYTPVDRAGLLASFGNRSGAHGKVNKNLPDYLFYSILSSGMAYDGLKLLIGGYYGEDDPELSERIQEATDLITLSERLSMEPHANRGLKILNSAKEAGRSTAIKIREARVPLWQEWQKMADEIWARNKDHTALAVAAIISKKTGEPKHTIRKRIKKPAR